MIQKTREELSGARSWIYTGEKAAKRGVKEQQDMVGTKGHYSVYFCSLITGACLLGQRHLYLTEQERAQGD